jgi:hypothetical protein
MDPQSSSSPQGADDSSLQAKPAAPGQDSLPDKAAKLIAKASSVFFVLFAFIVVLDSLPPRLLDPVWLIQTATSLTNVVSFPLAGLFFVHIAAALAPLNAGINQQRMRLSRLAAWAAVAYLMLIPLMGFAVWRGVNNVNLNVDRETRVIARTADKLIKAVELASTPLELQQSMRRLQGPLISRADLTRPLPELKQAQLTIIGQIRQNLISQLPRSTTNDFFGIYIQALRASILSLVSAVGFAALSWNAFKESTLLDLLMTPQQTESSRWNRFLFKSKTRFTEFRNRQQLEASTAERRSFWSNIKNREQMTAAKREKDLKRHAKRMRQMELDRQRQMRKNKPKP